MPNCGMHRRSIMNDVQDNNTNNFIAFFRMKVESFQLGGTHLNKPVSFSYIKTLLPILK